MAAADVIADATFEKTVLIEVDTPGMIAPAATATKPAINAYSIKSCPFRFRTRLTKKTFK